jgi:hypothetical protein
MLTTLLLQAVLAATPAAPAPAEGTAAPAHAPNEGALLRAAFPRLDEETGFLGHDEGYVLGRASVCAVDGICFLVVAAVDAMKGEALTGKHPWSTMVALLPQGDHFVEQGRVAGPVVTGNGLPSLTVAARWDRDGPLFTITTRFVGTGEGEASATHLWTWANGKFQEVLVAASSRFGGQEAEASYLTCPERPNGRPSYEVRTREREGRGKWTESIARYTWTGQLYRETAVDRSCAGGPPGLAGPTAAPATAVPLMQKVTASRSAAPPKGKPATLTAPGNAIDRDESTAWVTSNKKGGVGEWLQVDFSRPVVLQSITLNGTCVGPTWKDASRLRRVRLRFSDGTPEEATLFDEQNSQRLAVRRSTPTQSIRVEVLEVYRGTKSAEACITALAAQPR